MLDVVLSDLKCRNQISFRFLYPYFPTQINSPFYCVNTLRSTRIFKNVNNVYWEPNKVRSIVYKSKTKIILKQLCFLSQKRFDVPYIIPISVFYLHGTFNCRGVNVNSV